MYRWSCCVGDNVICRFRGTLKDFFLGSRAEMITVVLVVLNTICMAMEQEPKDDILKNFLHYSNYVSVLFVRQMFCFTCFYLKNTLIDGLLKK